MYVVLNGEEQNNPAMYPEWCNLSWFHNCTGVTVDVEPHYHDDVEIWLWHKGSADGIVGSKETALYPGVMVYTPGGCIHSYKAHGMHSNTGIVPKRVEGLRYGHLHVEKTGEKPIPKTPPFHRLPGKNPEKECFPEGSFIQNAYRKEFKENEFVLKQRTKGWFAVLVREGSIQASINGELAVVREPDLIIIKDGVSVEINTDAPSELAFVEGLPLSEGIGK